MDFKSRPDMPARTLERFIEAKGLRCRECDDGKLDPFVVGAEDSSSPLFRGTIPDVDLHGYIGGYLVHCTNCGSIKMLWNGIVWQWAEENDG
jgi:hypothetical protein